MKRKLILGLIFLEVFAFVMLNARVGYAASGAGLGTTDYEISWYTVDGGGAQDLTGGTYWLGGTTGQPDAGMLSGGMYTLAGGFWDGGLYLVYLPFITK